MEGTCTVLGHVVHVVGLNTLQESVVPPHVCCLHLFICTFPRLRRQLT